ncbi:MAG TPA: glycoside hydrolase family 78 protein, partial [Anaerolineales bacterium]|nr:glycoside hydrolase family 78 protein [Anaerolineales bacterium]
MKVPEYLNNKLEDGNMTKVTGLRCEHLVNPLGIEQLAPRLSWQMESRKRGACQTAYRLLAATVPGLLAVSKTDLWDSGVIKSDASVLIPYTGKELRSRQRCWWLVQVWDETGHASVSEPAYWEMGLLEQSDWKAQWIAADTPKLYHDVPASPLFRKAFHLNKPIRSARAYVCGLGFHEFFLNGQKVGDAVIHPAFTKYDVRVLYTVHEITDYLAPGDNAAGIMLGTGWYNHHAQDAWNFYTAPWRDECKALVQIEIMFEDGTQKVVCSDATWRSTTGPILFDGLRNGEIYDARAEKEGWNTPGYTAKGWKPVRLARHPGGMLHAQIMPPCRVTETFRPASVKEVKPGVWVYDLGRNIAGWARLSVSGKAGTTIVMRYAERLGPDGDIDQSHSSSLVKTEGFQTDTYILNGKGLETYAPRFAYHGFQYIQVSGLPGKAARDMLTGCVVHTDLERTGSFECSNELINRIQQAAIASTLGNYHGMPTDCPQREKNGWTGDAQLSAEQVLFNFDPASAYTKWLDDFIDCQRPSGALPGIVPTGGWGYNWGAGPAWDSAFIMIPWYLYLYRGDIGILQRHYEAMKKYLGFLGTLASEHIIHFGLGDWCPPTPEPDSYKAPAELTNTAYYHADACLLARIAGLLGKAEDARYYDELAKKIKTSARKHYFDPGKGRLAGHSQTSIACFLYQGLVEPEEIKTFKSMLLEEIIACNDHLDCGILGTKYLLNVLTELEQADVAYRIVTQRDFPGWGFWLEQGATTLWETWDGNASRNHHMFSDVSAWFYKTLAGILPDPSRPGFKHIIIKPWPVEGLAWAKGETYTPYGLLKSTWHKENGRFTLDVSIPPNSSATVHLPAAEESAVLESGQPAQTAQGVSFLGMEQGRATYAVGAGHYRFESA